MFVLWFVLLFVCAVWNSYRLLSVNGYILGYDDNFYFAWARSIVLDLDVDFVNDLELGAKGGIGGQSDDDISGYLQHTARTSEGYLPNKYGIGMGLLALPSMFLGKAVVEGLGLLADYDVMDLSRVFAWVYVLNSILLGFVGLIVAYILLEPDYGAWKAFISIGLGTLGLSLVYYLWFEPTMAHAVSFFIITLYVLICRQWVKVFVSEAEQTSRQQVRNLSFVMGLVFGVACTVRYTNIVFALVPFVFGIKAWAKAGHEHSKRDAGWLAVYSLLLACAGAFVGFFPQLLAWKTIYGSWLVYSYQGEPLLPWPRYVFEVLFGLKNSLFVWTPLAVAAVAGLVMGAVRKSAFALSGLVVIFGLVWIYGSWECYWLGHSYGMRGLVDASFFFFVGFAEAAAWIESHAPKRPFLTNLVSAGIGLLVIWNVYFIFCYRSLLQPHGEPFAGKRLILEPERPLKRMLIDMGLVRP